MVDIANPLGGLALQGIDYWVMLALNMFLSTIIGGIVLLLVIGAVTKKTGENAKLSNVFLMSLLINAINSFGVLGLLTPSLPIPFAGLALQVLVWFGFVKLFFSDLSLVHALIVSVIAFADSILVVPVIVSFIVPFIPKLGLPV
jgi:hypothetical protein